MITHRPTTPGELRELLAEPTPRLYRGTLTTAPIGRTDEAANYETVELGGLDDSVELHAADLCLTAGAGATLGEIEEIATRAGFEFIGSPLLTPTATIYDLALAGVFAQTQPRGGRLAGQVTGLWTPVPESETPLLLGVRTAKGVTGYNLARAGLLGVPSLPAVGYELRLRAARQPKRTYVRGFSSTADAREFQQADGGRFWSLSGLGGIELLELQDKVRLAVWLYGERTDAPAGFRLLNPTDWHQWKADLRESLTISQGTPTMNPVFSELWRDAVAIPARTIA